MAAHDRGRSRQIQLYITCKTLPTLFTFTGVNFESVFSVGMESETKNFMAVCVETVNKYPLNDFVSPVFIFERLCSIIYPVSSFLLLAIVIQNHGQASNDVRI